MPRGVMRHPRYLFRSDYGPLLIYLTGKFSYISIAIGLAWGVGESLIEKKSVKKVTDTDVANEYRYLFLPLLCIQYGWRSVLEITFKCQIIVSTAHVVKKKFREMTLS